MKFKTREEIAEKIKGCDFKSLLDTFVYINNLKGNLISLKETPVFDTENARELLDHFMMIEDCIADRLFGNKNV